MYLLPKYHVVGKTQNSKDMGLITNIIRYVTFSMKAISKIL